MGYYVNLTNHSLTIQGENYPAIIERWHEFEASEEFTSRHYSSLFERYPDDTAIPTVGDLFERIGFEVNYQDEGLEVEGFDGKSWMEGQYIAAISDLIDEGWSLDWHGEDDEHWRQTAKGTTTGSLIFADLFPLIHSAKKAIAALNAAADGDSNDVEIQAGQDVRDALESLIAALE